MHTLASSAASQQPVRRSRRLARSIVCAALPVLGLAACGDRGILDPTPASSLAAQPGVMVTPDYSIFDTRSEFAAVGTVDHLNGFEDVTNEPAHGLPTPWTSLGVTYTSTVNAVLGPDAGFGVTSYVMSAEFGSPLTGQFAASDAYTMFGADVTVLINKAAVDIVLYTNLGSYSFPNLDVPLGTAGRRFFGAKLSRAGEYLTGFSMTPRGSSTIVALDDVAVGHVGGSANASPDAFAAGPYAGSEGSPISFTFGATDGDGDALAFAWDFGDGTTGTGSAPPASHTYADNGTYNVMLAVDDGRGGVDTARTTATISNVAPVVAPFALPLAPVPLTGDGATISVNTTYTDPGTADTQVATLDCGDGVAAMSSGTPNGTASGACTFSTPGTYAVQLTVTDDDGGSGSALASGHVIVYDPTVGSLTGGGWLPVRSSLSVALPFAKPKFTFGFTVQNEADATPTGSFEATVTYGMFVFRSTTLDWLAISGNVARLQGTGTLNGVAGYAFALTAIDDPAGDGLRVRVWNVGTGETVFDNQSSADALANDTSRLGGGGLAIRDK